MVKEYLDPSGLSYVAAKILAMIRNALGMQGVTTAGTGAAYTATVDGITELAPGATFMMIPHTTSTAVLPTLNVNNLGAKAIRRRVSNSTVTTVPSASANWLYAKKPIQVTFDGTYWIADMARPNAADIYGSVAIANGGHGGTTAEEARANLGAVALNGATATLTAAGWSNKQQTVNVTGVTANNTVIVGPAPASHMTYAENGIYCSAQAAGSLTFTCDYEPSADITVNVSVLA